jgi:hypothetical protein
VNWVDVTQAVGGVGSALAFVGLAYQVHLDRRTRQFEVYERISSRFSEVLWHAVQHPELHGIWNDPEWDKLANDEKLGYRYTRLAFDVLEQAWEAHDAGQIEPEVWRKWESWIRAWKGTRFYDRVVDYDDPLSPFQARFLAYVRSV